MKLVKIAFFVLLLAGCANTDDVDDSDVHEDIANSQGQSSDDSEESEDGEDATPAPTKISSSKAPHEITGQTAALMYDIASAALKKTDGTLSYSVRCTYSIKPLNIKGCMVKTGYLPGDAKTKIGRALVDAKNLPRKKTGANEAYISTNYTCVRGRIAEETSCSLDRD